MPFVTPPALRGTPASSPADAAASRAAAGEGGVDAAQSAAGTAALHLGSPAYFFATSGIAVP
jgi:hypothetical protein